MNLLQHLQHSSRLSMLCLTLLFLRPSPGTNITSSAGSSTTHGDGEKRETTSTRRLTRRRSPTKHECTGHIRPGPEVMAMASAVKAQRVARCCKAGPRVLAQLRRDANQQNMFNCGFMCVYLYVYIYTHTNNQTNKQTNKHTHTHPRARAFVHTCISVDLKMYHRHVHIYICVHTSI